MPTCKMTQEESALSRRLPAFVCPRNRIPPLQRRRSVCSTPVGEELVNKQLNVPMLHCPITGEMMQPSFVLLTIVELGMGNYLGSHENTKIFYLTNVKTSTFSVLFGLDKSQVESCCFKNKLLYSPLSLEEQKFPL